ncbi:hypothetical protein, partial [Escherichia coli]|uniref:hypothetical protein n=1 Tax=Escherichia coli TaxID=562 RepID=UPI0024C00CA1
TIVSVVTLVWGISPRQPSGKNIIRWLLKKRTNGSVRYCQYTSFVHCGFSFSGLGKRQEKKRDRPPQCIQSADINQILADK